MALTRSPASIERIRRPAITPIRADYACHLGSRRLKRNLVFEIGVGGFEDPCLGGESLRMWRDYFIRSRIVGIDIIEKHCDHLGRRVDLVRADQSDESQLAGLVERYGRPDVVIDDGSHIGDHIIISFRTLFPLLRAGGIYVIEDLNTSFIPDFGGSIPPGERTGVGLVRSLAESTQSLDASFPGFWKTEPPPAAFGEVGAVHVYPGIVFVEKAAELNPRNARPPGQWHRSAKEARAD